MKIFRTIIFVTLLVPSITSCDLLDTSEGTLLSENEVIEGLKTALKVGTDSSVSVVSSLNGFYKDEAIKILLPPEAQIIWDNRNNALLKAIGFDVKLEEAIKAINYAAEDAAKEATPIFKSAITDMSISDGWAILNGTNPAVTLKADAFDSTAATAYLRSTTYSQLSDAFSPKVSLSLDKKLLGNLSPNQIWSTLTTSYNTVAGYSLGSLDPVENTDLGVYVTKKALDGLFLKVSDQEKQIRKDPLKWAQTAVGNILQKVFGNSSQ